MSNRQNQRSLALWCQDVITFLAEYDFPGKVIALKRAAVDHFRDSAKLYEIATVLAEDLSDLPEPDRSVANSVLKDRYGYGVEIFLDEASARIVAILRRGKIRNKEEFRVISEFVANTSFNEVVTRPAEELLESYSRQMNTPREH